MFRGRFFRLVASGLSLALIGGMAEALATSTPAFAAVSFAAAHADIYDSGYNQSYTDVLTVSGDTNPGIPTITSASSNLGTSTSGFTCGAPTTQTATSASCTITAAPGPADNVDSGVIGAAGTSNTVNVSETNSANVTTTGSVTITIYPAPICGASGTNPYTGVPGTAGAQIAPLDTTYGSPAVAEACYDGASGPASALLTNVSASGGTIFMGSNAIDAAGGTALTIMAGPGFNWTGGVGSGEQDVDTGTAGLNKQAWTEAVGTIDADPVASVTVTSGSPTLTVASGGFPGVVAGMLVTGTDIPTNTTVLSYTGGNSLTMSANATGTPAAETVTFTPDATVTSGSPTVSVPTGGFPGVVNGMTITGTDIPANTTVLSYTGGNSLTMSANATATPAAPEVVTFGAGTSAPPPSSFMTASSTVATEAAFKSSGDPLNTCPPTPAMIEAGASFCDEEFETTGAGPSAAQVALDYAGQAVPTTTSPTVALSSGTGSIGDNIGITDAPGACPSTIGTGSTQQNFFDGTYNAAGTSVTGTYNCWYARAGDASPVTVTVDGIPATVTPSAGDVSEADYSVDGPSDTATYDGAGTVTLMNVTGSSNTVSCSASSAGSATAPYSDLLGDAVSGTDIPVGTEVTKVVNSGSGTCSFTLSNAATATPAAETLTFYAVTLNPPQLNASFTVPPGTPTGLQTVEVCEATTPENGNDWEFGVQWMSPSGSLQYVSGNSGPTEVCGSSTIDVTTTSGTTTTPQYPEIPLGQSITDSASVGGSSPPGAPTGSVHFYVCGPSASSCDDTGTDLGSVGVTAAGDDATATSSAYTPASPGTYCFAGYYSGDVNYSASADTSADECFTVVSDLAITSGSPPTPLTEGQAMTPFQVTTSGGVGPNSYALTGAPSGITIDPSTGVISGTPGYTGGNFSETVTVTDTAFPSDTASATYNIYVQPSNMLHVTTTSLPSATPGQAYSASLAAGGGTPPYRWKIASGHLPTGLKLKKKTGVISGTPKATATSETFTVKVTDKSHPEQSATATLTITVS